MAVTTSTTAVTSASKTILTHTRTTTTTKTTTQTPSTSTPSTIYIATVSSTTPGKVKVPPETLTVSTPPRPEYCTELEYEELITYKGCATNVTLIRCEGMCQSTAKLNAATMTVHRECSCCVPLTQHRKELKLPCPDPDNPGKRLVMDITIFGGCTCSYDGCTL
ncbi:hypothetical protein Y1Q_0006456 [Alligator mississippiensis]|uniref:CTCK domain-containing protein n=1 Tax=Alligator mississippiensis TaxID=8496 RepID=A0A151N390_ALLMI|nr:hypothetical protein Y1Q_0006456 [Alligator mississippiensis]